MLDPQDGSILTLASRRPGVGAAAATTLTEPFEPGSTLKPFIAAALLGRGRVTPADVVDTHAGRLVINGRTLTDTHFAPSMTLRDVIRWSSNVGIVQFAQRLTPAEEYEALRDVGFGLDQEFHFLGELPGTLRDPSHWSKQSPASLAIGYELAVTPLQLALAYGAIANGGELLEPSLIREIRSPDGSVLYERHRRVVRRVMSADVARQLRDILIETVAHGTATGADLPSFAVAGKTGTARRVQYGAGYERNEYTASFVGLFPGRDPQYVVLLSRSWIIPRAGISVGRRPHPCRAPSSRRRSPRTTLRVDCEHWPTVAAYRSSILVRPCPPARIPRRQGSIARSQPVQCSSRSGGAKHHRRRPQFVLHPCRYRTSAGGRSDPPFAPFIEPACVWRSSGTFGLDHASRWCGRECSHAHPAGRRVVRDRRNAIGRR